MMTIPSVLDSIKAGLVSHFDALDFHWKTAPDQAEFEQAKPHVYLFNCPKAERNEANFPARMPSVTVVVDDAAILSADSIQLSLTLHCCVVNSAIIDREKTVMLDDGIHYAYQDEDGYTDAGVESSLYRDCMLLGEETMHALDGIDGTGRRVSDIRLIPPASDMDDFPYCQCQVTCKVAMLNARKPVPTDDSYYDLL